MIRTRKAPARFLSALLCLVMMLTLLPTVAFAYSAGDISGTTGAGTVDDPVVCDTFAEFKAAMENTEITYVKLNGVSGTNGLMPVQDKLAAAITNTKNKVLTIEGTNTFYAPLNSNNDCLIWPRAELTINGTGTLKYEHGNTGGTGAVINMASNVSLTINGNVTLEGGANGNVFGYAIFAQAGTTTINGGSFTGYNAFIASHAAMSAVSISSSANLTINGGNFSASLHPDSPEGKKAHSLSITSTATGTISIKEGTFPQGINIDATGKTITTCGYFDTAKASITAGGNPVGATASIDVLKSTPVIVTDTSVIGSVTVAVTAPVAGAATTVPTTSTANVAVSNSQWTIRPGGTGISFFEAGKTYRCAVILNPTSGYTFNSGTTVTIGGQTATIDSQSAGEIRAHYDFTTSAVPVSSVAISVTAPTAGATQAAPTTSTANVSIDGYWWKTGGNLLAADATFEPGKTYRLEMNIHPTTGQTLSTTATATVNGNAATIMGEQAASYLNCYYEFTIPAAVVPVSSVAISVTAPTAGATPSAPTTSTANVSIAGYQWKLGGNPLAEGATFEYGKTYRLEMTIHPTTGQSLSTTATATVNGNAATVMDHSTSYLNCYYDFTIPEATTIDTIAATITAPKAGATPDLNLVLPIGVQIFTSGNNNWFDMSNGTENGTVMAPTDTYIAGRTYRCRFTVETKPGYVFADSISAVTLNGNATTIFFKNTNLLVFDATFVATAQVDSIAATITPPKAGATRDLNLVLPTGVQIYTSGNNNWFDMSNGTETGTVMTSTDTYIAGRTYRCRFTVEPKPGYVFADSISAVTLNGNATTILAKNTNLLVFDATFTPTITSVDVTPATANVQKGTTQQFNAAVTGTGAYDNTVAWTVEGGVSGTTISTSGLLTVDAAETTTTLTVKATANGDNSKTDTATVTVTSAPVTKYTLTVAGGTGDGDYEENAVVNISADAPATGKQFTNWTTSNGGSFANANSASTTYTMPAGAATVTANYEDILVTVSSIAVNSTGHKIAYTVGDALDVTGLTILVTKSDGSSSTVNVTNGMVSGFNSSAAATSQILTITYEGKSTTYNVSISPVAATTYTINFNANGGSVGMASATTGTDGKLASLPTPTRSGSYSFKGWYTATSGGTQVTTSYVFSNNTTIYAQWNYTGGTGGGGTSYTYYTITATAGAGGNISTGKTVSVRAGESAGFTMTPDKG